jgi:hypothetical protein
MHFRVRQGQFIGVVVSRPNDPRENIFEFRIVADEFQEGFAGGALFADAEQVLGRGIHRDDQERAVKQDDAATQALDEIACFAVEDIVVVARRVGTAGTPP